VAGKPGRSGGARTGAGRKPLPTAVKAVKGTLRKGRTNPAEPGPTATLADPPLDMREAAADLWRYLVSNTPAGVLHANNAALLERYCELLAQYREVVREIAKRGVGGLLAKDRFGLPTRSILFELQMELSRLLKECETELGFTPVSRARVQVPQVPATRSDDPWADIAG
jgi:P27 family predicted phage terminase small subunit